MVEVTKFRNVVAHTYGLSIDHDAVDNALGDPHRYREFVVEICSCLESIDTLGEGGRMAAFLNRPHGRVLVRRRARISVSDGLSAADRATHTAAGRDTDIRWCDVTHPVRG